MIRRKILDSLLDDLTEDQLGRVTAFVILMKESDAAGVTFPYEV